MNNDEIELNRELREYRNECILQKKVMQAEQEKFANLLKGEMGKDIHDVLNGKTKVKLSLWEIVKYKINYYINKILRIL